MLNRVRVYGHLNKILSKRLHKSNLVANFTTKLRRQLMLVGRNARGQLKSILEHKNKKRFEKSKFENL